MPAFDLVSVWRSCGKLPTALVFPLQITESHLAAGTAPHLVFARIDAPRFAKIYSAKGRWGLLDQLMHVSASEAPPPEAAPSASAGPAPAALPAVGGGSSRHAAAVSLEQVAQAVRAAAADVLGEEVMSDGTFAAGGFDSLSAVELSSSLSSSLGVQLPATLVFDYPSVSAMAQHIHSLLAPTQPADGASGELVPAGLPLVGRSSPGLAGSLPISIALATRLPGEVVAGSADGISSVPFSRWDLEAMRVSCVHGWVCASAT